MRGAVRQQQLEAEGAFLVGLRDAFDAKGVGSGKPGVQWKLDPICQKRWLSLPELLGSLPEVCET